jgi:hypothetical protein
MDDTKSMWTSKGVWGSLIAIGSGVLVASGAVGPDEASQLQQSGGELVAQVTGIVGGVLALWGRIAAKSQIR